MSSSNDIDADLVERLLDRLGIDGVVACDAQGLAALYRAWCRHVPFDNVRKLIALRSDDSAALPGGTPQDFFEAWLDHGVGGTCWPGTLAMAALCRAVGFDVRVIAASMADTGVASHGTTVAHVEGSDWLIDTSMLTEEPLLLSAESETCIAHPVFGTTATPVPEGWLFAFPLPFAEAQMPCRTISRDTVTVDFCLERYEVSREISPFNDRVSTRRNVENGVVSFGGGKRYQRVEGSIDERELTGADLESALIEEFGMSEQIVSKLAATGATSA